MSGRTLFFICDSTHRWFSTSMCYRTKLSPHNYYKQIREFKRIKDVPKKIETELSDANIQSIQSKYIQLWKPLGFTILFSGATLTGAAIWEYERIRTQTYRMMNHFKYNWAHKTGWRGQMELWWRNLSDGHKVFAPICFINVLVFLAWRVPSLKHTMIKYFTSNPTSGAICWPMLFSTFSHYSFFHLAANMYVLQSFSTTAVHGLGREQFVAFYLCSGVVSSFVSLLYKTMFALPGLSLGASGAVMGVLGYVCTQYPDIRLSIILIPMYTFTAGAALKGIIALDSVGCLLRWKFFDHAAHLGGVMFGIFWQNWGQAGIWLKREPLLTFWHNLRDPPRSN